MRLMLALELGIEEPVARSIAKKVGTEELVQLKNALENRVAEYLPVQTQLFRPNRDADMESGFLI